MFLGTYIESVWQVGDNGCIGLILRQRVFDHRWACYALAECMIIRFVHSGVVILAQNTRRHTACSEQNFVDTSSVLEDSSSFRLLKLDFTGASLRCGCYLLLRLLVFLLARAGAAPVCCLLVRFLSSINITLHVLEIASCFHRSNFQL